MATNRLLPGQWAPGQTLDATRIEAALLRLAELYDDVPAEFVKRRWSPSSLVWGFSPAHASAPGTPTSLPFLGPFNYGFTGLQPITTVGTNITRAKSNTVPEYLGATGPGSLLTWEVTLRTTRPMIIGSLTLFADVQGNFVAAQRYTNPWQYGAVPPTGKAAGEPTTDFTLQICLSDGWDLENRKKLRQEALIYQMRSDAFNFTPASAGAVADTMQPQHPTRVFTGFGLALTPLILVPVGARVIFQWTIPVYPDPLNATWGATPALENVWNFCAQCWEATR